MSKKNYKARRRISVIFALLTLIILLLALSILSSKNGALNINLPFIDLHNAQNSTSLDVKLSFIENHLSYML